MATTLSGTSGALYYKPAGTDSTFTAANVTNASNNIMVGTYRNFKVNDKVSFGTGSGGTLPGGLSASTDVFIRTYTASTGIATFSATAGGTELALSSDGTDGTTPFTIKFKTHSIRPISPAWLMVKAPPPSTPLTTTPPLHLAWWKT